MNITVETIVNAPIEKVWHTYNSPEHIVKWNAASEDWHTISSSVDLRVGGKFSTRMEAKDGSFGFDFAGIYTKVNNNNLIEYYLGERTVKIEFSKVSKGVKVLVEFESEATHSIEQQQQGWQAILNSLLVILKKQKAIKSCFCPVASSSVFGSYYGIFRDKFGIEWMVDFDPKYNEKS